MTPRNPKTYISGGHIGRAFINNKDQSARAPIAASSLCRLDFPAVDSNRAGAQSEEVGHTYIKAPESRYDEESFVSNNGD